MKTLKTRTFTTEEVIIHRERVRLDVEGKRIMIVGSKVQFHDSEAPLFHVDFFYKRHTQNMKWERPVAAYRKIMKIIINMYERAYGTGCDLGAYPTDWGRERLYVREMRKRGMTYTRLENWIMFHP